MIEHFTRADAADEPRLFDTMHQDRKRVFIDALKWEIPNDGCWEMDQFDTNEADYLILRDPDTGCHLASVRLLRTTVPHILSEVFPFLCEAAIPRGPSVREITRFVVSPDVPVRERLATRNMLGRAMIEFGQMVGVTMYTAVCDFGFLTQLLAADWHITPLGMPQYVEGSLIGALKIRLDRNSLARTSQSWRCDAQVLRVVERSPALVA
jgi:acyl-homoserine lactone synthase